MKGCCQLQAGHFEEKKSERGERQAEVLHKQEEKFKQILEVFMKHEEGHFTLGIFQASMKRCFFVLQKDCKTYRRAFYFASSMNERVLFRNYYETSRTGRRAFYFAQIDTMISCHTSQHTRVVHIVYMKTLYSDNKRQLYKRYGYK